MSKKASTKEVGRASVGDSQELVAWSTRGRVTI